MGRVKLIADGSTATRPGNWPTLEYEMVTVAGNNNTIGMPIYLLPIDLAQGLYVDETRGGTITLPDVPGFSLTIKPGSTTFPDGTHKGTVSVTLVHPDKVPMTPNFGQQPRFIVTIQPAGVRFDPPAPMTLPNTDGLGSNEITEMYSFDHDLGSFVAIGTGSVSDDGSTLRSDNGVGIVKGGWHCGGNPTPTGSEANLRVTLSSNVLNAKVGDEIVLTANGKPDQNTKYVDWDIGGNEQSFELADFTDPKCENVDECKLKAKVAGVGIAEAKVAIECTLTGDKEPSNTLKLEFTPPDSYVSAVTFALGTGVHKIIRDNGLDYDYVGPQWTDSDGNLLPEKNIPLAATRKTAIAIESATIRMKISESLTNPSAEVRATGPMGFLECPPNPVDPPCSPDTPIVFTWHKEKVHISNDTVTLDDAVPDGGVTLPNKIVGHPFLLYWEWRFLSSDPNDDEPWYPIGHYVPLSGVGEVIVPVPTSHRIYVTLADPVTNPLYLGTNPLYESVVDIACRAADGTDNEPAAVAMIWGEFSDRIVNRKTFDGEMNFDFHPMKYWIPDNDMSKATFDDLFETAKQMSHMLDPHAEKYPDVGTCFAWSDLFVSTLLSIGIADAQELEINPISRNAKDRLMVKNWDFGTAQPSAEHSGYPYSVKSGIRGGDAYGQPEGDTVNRDGVPGQGPVNEPPEWFLNHKIVLYANRYYDPSYGGRTFDSEAEHAKAAFDGVMRTFIIMDPSGFVFRKNFAKNFSDNPLEDVVYCPNTCGAILP